MVMMGQSVMKMIQITLLAHLISASMEEHVWKNSVLMSAVIVQWDLMETGVKLIYPSVIHDNPLA